MSSRITYCKDIYYFQVFLLMPAKGLKKSLMSKFNKILYCNDMLIPSSLILEAIKKLECGK